MDTQDVEMVDGAVQPPAIAISSASRSSSLSAPPSSLPEETSTSCSQPASLEKATHNPDSEQHDISLDNITISSPRSQDQGPMTMMTTRSARRKEAGGQPTERKSSSPGGDGRKTPPSPSTSKPKSRARIVFKKSARKKWTAEKLLTNPKSPLAKADIRSLLCNNSEAWDILNQDERAVILSLFPPGTPIIDAGTPNARPDMTALSSDDNFRHDCARFAENLIDGKHDPQWLAEAWAASDQRRAGEFDEYLEDRFEEEWEVTLPDDMKRGEARTKALDEEGSGGGGSRQSPPSRTDEANDQEEDKEVPTDANDEKETATATDESVQMNEKENY